MAAICVYCASSTRIDASYVDLAEQVGAELARRGHTLVSGGGRISCMGAVARAARAGGAWTVGVIPEMLRTVELADEDNDELVVTRTMRERKHEMDVRADAFLTLPGGIGTFEELFEIWVTRSLHGHQRPVVVLDPDGLFAPLREQIDVLVEKGFVRREAAAVVRWTTTVTDAFDALEAPVRPTSVDAEELLEAEP